MLEAFCDAACPSARLLGHVRCGRGPMDVTSGLLCPGSRRCRPCCGDSRGASRGACHASAAQHPTPFDLSLPTVLSGCSPSGRLAPWRSVFRLRAGVGFQTLLEPELESADLLFHLWWRGQRPGTALSE